MILNSKFEAANVEYKYLICTKDLKKIVWETGDNRKVDLSAFYENSTEEYELLIEDAGFNERK